MNAVAAEALIAAWEDCHGRTHSEVAVRLLQLGWPALAPGELAELPIGRRDALLIDLREALHGSSLELRTSCPHCNEEFELDASLDEVRRVAADDDVHGVVDVDEHTVRFRVPSSRDIAAAMAAPSDAARRLTLLRRCVECSFGDDRVDPADLPDHVVAAVEAAMEAADQQATVALPLECPECGQHWDGEFDIVPVLWAEVNGRARRELLEVHVLASAYGWTEAEVLAVTPRRRQFYLEQV